MTLITTPRLIAPSSHTSSVDNQHIKSSHVSSAFMMRKSEHADQHTRLKRAKLDKDEIRKRAQVACGRCRKRKIKCKAPSSGEEGCESCIAAGAAQDCQYFRVGSKDMSEFTILSQKEGSEDNPKTGAAERRQRDRPARRATIGTSNSYDGAHDQGSRIAESSREFRNPSIDSVSQTAAHHRLGPYSTDGAYIPSYHTTGYGIPRQTQTAVDMNDGNFHAYSTPFHRPNDTHGSGAESHVELRPMQQQHAAIYSGGRVPSLSKALDVPAGYSIHASSAPVTGAAYHSYGPAVSAANYPHSDAAADMNGDSMAHVGSPTLPMSGYSGGGYHHSAPDGTPSINATPTFRPFHAPYPPSYASAPLPLPPDSWSIYHNDAAAAMNGNVHARQNSIYSYQSPAAFYAAPGVGHPNVSVTLPPFNPRSNSIAGSEAQIVPTSREIGLFPSMPYYPRPSHYSGQYQSPPLRHNQNEALRVGAERPDHEWGQ